MMGEVKTANRILVHTAQMPEQTSFRPRNIIKLNLKQMEIEGMH